MKKFIILSVIIFLIIGGLKAQYIETSISSGVVTDDSFSFKPFYWTVGINVDFYFGELIMISPECYMVTHYFDEIYLTPAVLLNLNLSDLIIGGGVTKWYSLKNGGDFSTDTSLKLNAGLNGESFRIMWFIITPFDNLFAKGMTVGLTLGLTF